MVHFFDTLTKSKVPVNAGPATILHAESRNFMFTQRKMCQNYIIVGPVFITAVLCFTNESNNMFLPVQMQQCKEIACAI